MRHHSGRVSSRNLKPAGHTIASSTSPGAPVTARLPGGPTHYTFWRRRRAVEKEEGGQGVLVGGGGERCPKPRAIPDIRRSGQQSSPSRIFVLNRTMFSKFHQLVARLLSGACSPRKSPAVSLFDGSPIKSLGSHRSRRALDKAQRLAPVGLKVGSANTGAIVMSLSMNTKNNFAARLGDGHSIECELFISRRCFLCPF